LIHDYFANVQQKIIEIQALIKDSEIEFRVISSEMGMVKGRLIFIDDTILDFRELLGEQDHDYRFQWMMWDYTLISRWDSSPHHKELKTFPFHRHTDKGTIVDSKEIDLLWLLDEVKNNVLKNTLDDILKNDE